jgi:hypothetical protein
MGLIFSNRCIGHTPALTGWQPLTAQMLKKPNMFVVQGVQEVV